MFSEKYGYKPEKFIQHKSISSELRCRIWNLFYQMEIKSGGLTSRRLNQALSGEQTIEEKIADRMGYLIDSTSAQDSAQARLKSGILHAFDWFEVYDFVEIYLSFLDKEQCIQRVKQYNEIFEQEKAGYRIIASEVVPITNEIEIQGIDHATNTKYQSVNLHIQKALTLYADRKAPDYENSIKESISAVESMCCIITGLSGKDATLGKTIKKLKDEGIYIHMAMEKAFLALYGYTSDEDGIRHGSLKFKNAPAEDAKYMLVSCSAFVNYLIEKWGIVNFRRRNDEEQY